MKRILQKYFRKHLIKKVFYSLVIIFFIIVSFLFLPIPDSIKRTVFPFLAALSIIFFLLGVVLVVLTLKRRVKGKLKKFLILTGFSAAGFFIGVILHNFLYALAVITLQITLLHYLFEVLHVIFFIFATIVCPLTFLVGVIGSTVLFTKQAKK